MKNSTNSNDSHPMTSIHRMTRLSLLFFAIALLFSASAVFANNLTISNLAMTGQNTGSHFVMVQFDVSWENSWRNTSSAPNNWDAVYLFIKYKKVSDGNWYHCTLNSTGHITGSQGASATITPLSTGKGVFLYRAGNGTGTFSSTSVQLRWKYGTDGVSDNLTSVVNDIQIFGIEMVYVPQGAFSLGSGGSEYYPFYTYPTTTNPYQVTSENAITVGTANGNLYYSLSAYSGDQSGPIPTAFPKGYNAFYCMKYEITQEQYVGFLNTLTRAQQANRVGTYINGTSITNRYVMSNSSAISWRNGIRCDATIPASPVPVTFYCDYNGNGTPNEAGDGQNIACNYMNWADGAAYSDWSGLRPMTELEFEKACRGTASAVANEYAWGNTTITESSAVTNVGAGNETAASGNCNYLSTGINNGPIRVGIFAGGGTTRAQSGASYYGIMEMSGNLWELAITVGNSTGRAFSGLNGDGSLDASGNANTSNWPSTDAFGSGFRGGSWDFSYIVCRVSDRYFAANTFSDRISYDGFRCIAGLY